ncbi:MAG: glycosyltransferase family 2 protein [Anaerolineae bacterium]|nr:glycosyltransferase family 2 protein [Anaerolineae bacterium]
MDASVIVLAWNGMDYLPGCLDSLLAQEGVDFEVIVVDNGSSDGSPDLIARQYSQVRLIRNERNLGFAAGNNVGLRAATGDVLVLLNQDTVVHGGWLAALASTANDPAVGIVGCKLLYPDGTIQHAGGYLDGPRGAAHHVGRHEPDEGQYDQPGPADFVTGAAIALSRDALVRIGPLDEGFAPAYFEDADWCYRARAQGLRVLFQPRAVATHYESTSVDVTSEAHKAAYHYGRLRFLFKHQPLPWLQDVFAPAEVAGIRDMQRIDEMMAIREACLRLLFSLAEIAAFRQQPGRDALAEWAALQALVAQLRAACLPDRPPESLYAQLGHTAQHAAGRQILEQAASADQAPPPAAPPAAEPPPDAPGNDLLERLQAQWKIEERPFRSAVPLVGPGIAAFRDAWNKIATRWYVLPLLQQQNELNYAVALLLAELFQRHHSLAELFQRQHSLISDVFGRQDALAAQQTEMHVRQERIAVSQVEILHILRQLLDQVEGQRRDVAQGMREIDRLAAALVHLQARVDGMEGEPGEGS